jgi:prepilin-type N-terminal cleavage/methylation domain-containing protein
MDKTLTNSISRVKQPSHRRGFTLVEMLVALCVLAIFSVGLASVFFSGMKLYKKVSGDTQGTLELETFSRDLRQTWTMSAIKFSGNSSRVEFPAVLNYRVAKVIYEYDPLNKQFICRWIDYRDILNHKEEYEQKVLFSAAGVEFSYFVFERDSGAYTWTDEWEKEGNIPLAVKIKAVIKDRTLERVIFIPAARTAK